MSRLVRTILFLSPLPFAGAVVYTYASRKLAKDFPDIPIQQLPEGSFTRRIMEESSARGLARWGREGSGDKDRPLYAAYTDIYQTTIPRSSLESYGARLLEGPLSRKAYETDSFTHAFLNSGLMSRHRRLMSTKRDEREQRGVFEPGQEAMGGTMWVLRSTAGDSSAPTAPSTTAAQRQSALDSLPPDVQPPSSVPSATGAPNGIGSTVFFWRMPASIVSTCDTLASYGYPWRFMLGGYHELLVEEAQAPSAKTEAGAGAGAGADEPMLRVTFTSAHVYERLQGDGKTIPGFGRAMHALFGRALLASAKRRIESC
ncbi:hypothetical protein DACRYDRAFT_114190 [Dacryopinax primogenitus]|uniref:Uncharacterized protein n=1 Tax=Dacryopinax primogenitus (strain DJM 731) TaxID=1858805 RepID=M5GG49_DACPD|nr:uncharacterized protein DACRYDRAFT_114190 [Dacryopinax primogenitus]EJU04868.1 hypothetical protein DACRYDRAFT_114190 [Dacryopinax primogenitus]